ncbi:MAG: InlB B-repeat-containing protein, partial [Treponema sp.]|nr:InlB B-repeat-containing protein [Treponema sp.]
MKNRAFMKKTLLAAVLCAALSAFMGCDDGSKDPERETYTVTYNANGGSGTAPSAQTANSGSSVTLSGQGSLTYSGKTFNGWNTNSAGTGTAYTAGASLTVAGNSTLYAQWTAVQYTVTYNANGGSGNAPSAQTVNAGSSATLSGKGSLTYSGKTFDGWNTNSSGTGTAYAAGASLTVAGNVTLYAQWISQNAGGVTYVLRPNPGYDDYVCVADDMLPAGFAVNAGDQVTISFSVKTGVPLSTFTIGIADWTNGGGWTAPGWDDPKEVAADGQYHSVEWTLTAAASGPAGDNPLAIQFSTSGASEPEIAIYVRDVSINGGGETDPPAPAQYTVTFNTDGTTETRTVSGGGTVGSNMPSNPAKSGYSFDGWYTAQNGGGSQFTASTPVTGSITVYAKWSYTGETDPPAPAQYTVTYNANGGSGTA